MEEVKIIEAVSGHFLSSTCSTNHVDGLVWGGSGIGFCHSVLKRICELPERLSGVPEGTHTHLVYQAERLHKAYFTSSLPGLETFLRPSEEHT